MSLTCSRCLAGDPQRCQRGQCARWLREGPKVPYTHPTNTRPSRYVSTGRPVGRPAWYGPAELAEVARYLVLGSTIHSIREHTKVGRDKIRSIRRELLELERMGVTAGPVGGERLPDGRHLTGFATTGQPANRAINRPYGVRGIRADSELIHKAALILIDGHSYRHAAEVTGLTPWQCRTIRANLRVLAGRAPTSGVSGVRPVD